jgi:hypothetical protein
MGQLQIDSAGLSIQHTFEVKNDDIPIKKGPEAAGNSSVERIQTAIENAYPQSPPQDVISKFEHLKVRATQVGIGSPPQLTFVCKKK